MPGTTETTRIGPDGVTTTTTTEAPGLPQHHGNNAMPPEAAFFLGMIAGAIIYWLVQRGNRAKAAHRAAELALKAAPAPEAARIESEVSALARRTATLERIVTDRSARVADEIDALR